MAILNHGSTIRTADGGQSTTTIVTASNIGSYAVASNATYYIGTTQNVFNRASGAQTLTGVSIDGNAATVTNGVYTTGEQTIAGAKTFNSAASFSANAFLTGSSELFIGSYMSLQSSSTIMGMVGFNRKVSDGTIFNSSYAAYQLHNNTGTLNLQVYSSAGGFVGAHTFNSSGNVTFLGTVSAATDFRAPIFYDSNDTGYYINPNGTSSLVNVIATEFYARNWFRNDDSGEGIYNQTTTQHFYSDDVSYWNVASSSGAQGIRFRTGGYAGTVRGYVYANDSNDVGLLNNGGNWRARVVGGDYFLADGSSIRGQIFYDSNDTNYYCDPNGSSVLASVTANAYYPRAGVTESDIYAQSLVINAYHHGDSLTYDTFQFNGASVYETKATSGSSFVSASVDTSIFKGDRFGGMTIANGVYQARWTWNNTIGYKFFKSLYIANSTNGNSFTVTIETSGNGTTWTTVATTGSMSNWPGHSWYNYAWNNNATQGYIRITVTPTWANANTINIYNMRYFCSYNLDAGSRLYDWDYSKNVTFLVSAAAPIFYDSDNTSYYINAASASSLNTLTMAGIITTVSSGTAINFSGQSDSFGYNATAGQGTYIKGTGATYIYGGGVFYDGSAIRTLLHSNNYSGYSAFSGAVSGTSFSGTSVNIAGNSASADPYGTIAVTEPAGASNYSYYGLTRQANIGTGFGLTGTTGALGLGANAFWFGTSTSTAAGVMGSAYIAFNGSSFVTVGTVDGTQFRDRDDTTYYLDPASTTLSLKTRSSVVITNANAPENLAMLNIGYSGSGETRAIDIKGGWSANESKSITFNHATGSANIVAQINAQHNGPGSRLRWGKLYHSGDSSTYTMELISESTTSAYLTVAGSVRSPIFYDSGDTNYYLDPAGTSRLNTTRIGNINVGSGTYLNTITPIGDTNINLSAPSGAFYFDTFPRMPGFYDSADTTYYIDPAGSTSINVNGYIISSGTGGNKGAILGNLQVGYAGTYNTVQTPTNADTIWLQYSHSGNVGLAYGGGYTTAYNSIRSPIFYDSDNTAYYANPAGTSVFNELVFGSNITIRKNNDRNLEVQGGGGPDSGIVGKGSSGQFAFQVYGSGSGSYGFLDGVWAGWDIRKVVDGDLFLNDNNSYYLNPASTSLFNATRHNSVVAGSTSAMTSAGALAIYSASSPYISFHDGGAARTAYMQEAGGRFYFGEVTYTESEGSFRSPLFYDVNDTNYYIDPASTSILNTIRFAGKLTNNGSVSDDDGFGIYWDNSESTAYAIYREAGSWTSPYPDLRIAFHTGIKLGANAGYNGIRFYNDYDMATQVMSVNNSGDGLGANNVYVNNALQAGGSLRAPIFYDSNDTTYYLDPNNTGTSLLVAGSVGIGTTSPAYKLQVNGSFAATTKSFDIPHPTKENKRLVYASLEGPENGVYVRGKNKCSTIYLPDYWTGLVYEDSITVSITPIGKTKQNKIRNYSVTNIEDNMIQIFTDSEDEVYDFNYIVYAERKDVAKLVVEKENE